MLELEEDILERMLQKYDLVLWVPNNETAKRVIAITEREDEPVALFPDGTYAAIMATELSEFVVGTRLKNQE